MSFHLVKPDGWEYDVTVELPSAPLTASKSISSSPPGKAILSTVVDSPTIAYEGTLSGRSAPNLQFAATNYMWVEPGLDDQHGNCYLVGSHEGEAYLTCETAPLALAEGDPVPDPSEVEAFQAQYERGAVELTEDEVDAFLDLAGARPQPDFFYLNIKRPAGYVNLGCDIKVWYDGHVEAGDWLDPGKEQGCQVTQYEENP